MNEQILQLRGCHQQLAPIEHHHFLAGTGTQVTRARHQISKTPYHITLDLYQAKVH
jgi:hypothetical protein